jgi:hypothetical protein
MNPTSPLHSQMNLTTAIDSSKDEPYFSPALAMNLTTEIDSSKDEPYFSLQWQ